MTNDCHDNQNTDENDKDEREMNEMDVEAFYDEMLKSELMDQDAYDAAKESALRRADTMATEQSEASTDSGKLVNSGCQLHFFPE